MIVIIFLNFLVLVISLIVIYVASRRNNLRATPFIYSNTVGFIGFAIISNLLFGLIMDSSFIFTDLSSILGGGLGWTAVVLASIMKLRPSTKPMAGHGLAADNSAALNYSTVQALWTLIGYGLAAVATAILSAILFDFIVFFMFGVIGIQITDLPVILARIIYVLVCIISSYFAFDLFSQRKSQLIHQALYSRLANSIQVNEKEMAFQEDKPKRMVWVWWPGGCAILVCAALGITAFFLFSPSEESYPLDGEVLIPSAVKQSDNFDVVITLTNSTTKPIFIKHVVLHSVFDAPSLLNGATVTEVEPAMGSEPLAGSSNEVQYSYFREIRPGETQRVIFHMQAVNTGSYYTNVGVYGTHPLLPDPAFIVAFYFATAATEITP